MSFRLRLKYYLVHKLNYAGKKADELILSGKVSVSRKYVKENVIISDEDEIIIEGEIVRKKTIYEYYAVNKPRGIESSFDHKVENNLSKVFPLIGSYFVAGRLDKDSEGLLLISNDGKWINEISRPESNKEKEYEVETDISVDGDFIKDMQSGVDIGFYLTKPCKAWKIEERKFGIILTEGKNKQIRRMCKKLGRKVLRLKRSRIDKFYLADLEENVYNKVIL